MNNFRVEISTVGRSQGKSSVAAVAYQTGRKIQDHRLGLNFDHSKRQDVVDYGLALPNGGQAELDKFWNEIEIHHGRGDAVVARDMKLSIPKEISPLGRKKLVVAMAAYLASSYSVGVNWALHEPRYFSEIEIQSTPHQPWEYDHEGRMTNANWHAHLLLTACHVFSTTQNFQLGRKCLALDPIHCRRAKIENFASKEREVWCNLVNSTLQSEGHILRVSHKSYASRGIQKVPGRHLGATVYAIERRTGRSSNARKRELIKLDRLRLESLNFATQMKLEQEVQCLKMEERELIKEIADMKHQLAIDHEMDMCIREQMPSDTERRIQ